MSQSHTTSGRAGSRSEPWDHPHCRVSWLLTALLIPTAFLFLCQNFFHDDICGLVTQDKLRFFLFVCRIIMDLHELLGQYSLIFFP